MSSLYVSGIVTSSVTKRDSRHKRGHYQKAVFFSLPHASRAAEASRGGEKIIGAAKISRLAMTSISFPKRPLPMLRSLLEMAPNLWDVDGGWG